MKRCVYFVILVFLCSGALALEGVVPGSYDVEFEPGLERDFVFDFVLDGKEELWVEGDLSEYVELDKLEIMGRGDVVVHMKLPESLEKIGANEVWVVAGGVRGLIRVNVAYPERFVGLELSAPNVNLGEDVELKLKVLNLGRERVFVNPSILIYNPDGGLIEDVPFEGGWVNISGVLNFEGVLVTSNYSAGDYLAVARVDYGDGVIKEENVFRLGEFGIRILDYSKEFYGGRVNRFEIEVESLWDGKIKDVYAEVRVVGSELGFDSDIVQLGAWEKRTLIGFFDARGLNEDVDVEVGLYSEGEELSSEVLRLRFLEGFDWVILVKILFILVVAGFLFWRIARRFNK
ncbi:hypothetical protein K8R30_03595 [archaeon]|nr:hypothetical protein [archaeon]